MKKINRYILPILFFLSGIVWVYLFRDFLSRKLELMLDAQAYYEHSKFYWDQLGRGVFPMWDPDRDFGVPTEFFLRRIGSYNPFYFLILGLIKLGLPSTLAYFVFITVYFFIGMIGFYQAALRIFNEQRMAFTAYMLFTFSTFSCVLFNSFIILIFTPAIWFFYFLVSFVRKPKPMYLLGMTFCLMLLATTYIPYYFLTIFLSFILCFIVIYFREIPLFIKTTLQFVKENKLWVGICIVLLIVSFFPGIVFFQDLKTGEFVLPKRNVNASVDNVLAVAKQTMVEGGIVVNNFSREPFTRLKNIQPGALYMPVFIYPLLLLGLFIRLNKKLVLMATFGVLVYLISLYDSTPIYKFLYNHVFYFKYFRNFQFFLWLVVLPIFIILCVEQFRVFLNWESNTKKQKVGLILLSVLIHALFCIFLFFYEEIVFTSYVVIALSLVFFILNCLGVFKLRQSAFLVSIFCLILIQPIEVYHYLSRNSVKYWQPYRYDRPYLELKLPTEKKKKAALDRIDSPDGEKLYAKKNLSEDYTGTRWSILLREALNREAFEKYFSSKLLVYDKTVWLDDQNIDLNIVGQKFDRLDNVAFVSDQKGVGDSGESEVSIHPEIVSQESSSVKVIKFDVNDVYLKTNFDARKFLVYNDSFHSEWSVFIDGNQSDLWRANVAFKGVWVEAGEHIVHYHFGAAWRYVFHLSMIFIFHGVLLCLIHLFLQNNKICLNKR